MLRYHTFFVIFSILFPVNCIDLTFTVKNYSRCDGDENTPMHFIANFTSIGNNKFAVNGEYIFDEDISGPLEVCDFYN